MKQRGINIKSFSFHIEGVLNLHGFLGLFETTRPGYSGIKVKINIDADV